MKINVQKLTDFVKNTEFSKEPLRLNKATLINDRRKFAESHLSVIVANPENKITEPYYNRMLLFHKLLKEEKLKNHNHE